MVKRYFGLDLGEKYLKLCIAEEDHLGNLRPVALPYKKIESFKNGEIVDIDNFQTEVLQFLKDIGEQLGERIKELSLSFSAPYFNAVNVFGRAIVQGTTITADDIEKAKKIAKMSVSSSNLAVIFEEPIYYLIDNLQSKIKDPIGMEARTIEVSLFIIQALLSTLNKIQNTFEKAKIKINNILPNPLPAAICVLDKKFKTGGCIIIDFGFYLTSVAVYKDNSLVAFKVFTFGLYDLLQELAIMSEADLAEVERFIEDFLKADAESKLKLKIKLGKKHFNYQSFMKILIKYLIQITKNYGFAEWIKKIKENYKLPGGAYILSSASLLEDIQKTFRHLINMPVKLLSTTNKELSLEDHHFLNSWGLCLYQFRESTIARKSIGNFLKDLLRHIFRNQ